MRCARKPTNVKQPKWHSLSTSSTACWRWDARATSASYETTRTRDHCVHRLIHATRSRLADHRGFRCRPFADLIADDHRSGGDADANRELDPGRSAGCGIQFRHRIHDVETRPHRPLGLVLMGARVAEINEDAVAHVLRDKAVVAPDRRAAAALI